MKYEMKIIYSNKQTEKICENEKKAIATLGSVVAKKLMMLLDAIEEFPNLYDLFVMPQFRLHALSNDRKGQYSFVIHKGSKWRLIVYPMDEDRNILMNYLNEKEMLIKTVIVEIVEVSEHYD